MLAWVTVGVEGVDSDLDTVEERFLVEVEDKTRLRSPGGSDCFVAYANRFPFSLLDDVVSVSSGLGSDCSLSDVLDEVLLSSGAFVS